MLLSFLLLQLLSFIVLQAVSESADASDCTPSPAQCQRVNLTNLVSQIRSKQYIQSDNRRIFKRQVGRGGLGGCANPLLGQIMQHVVGPLQTVNQLRLGDVARILQQSVQQAIGKSHEIILGKGEMVTASHQMSETASCKLRIGEYYATAYETPVLYSIASSQQDEEMSNVDFGEELGGSGYPGQIPFPFLDPIEAALLDMQGLALAAGAGACFSGDLIVQTAHGPKRMSELKTGDAVLSVDQNTITFSPIIMFLHRDEQYAAEFNVITTVYGDTAKLTNEHLIHVIDCDEFKGFEVVSAKEVTTDHCVLIARSPERKLTIGRVANITKVHERGIYAPLTVTGDILVNDVLASCHTNLAFRTLQNTFFKVYRSLSFMLLYQNNGDIPFGVEFLISMLDLFVPFKAFL